MTIEYRHDCKKREGKGVPLPHLQEIADGRLSDSQKCTTYTRSSVMRESYTTPLPLHWPLDASAWSAIGMIQNEGGGVFPSKQGWTHPRGVIPACCCRGTTRSHAVV